ncbi:nuclease-related domain-containing protein [Aeromicrobium sp. 50.2.37]|uniref:nuclease-related domain-containing protein n=1 Tax=Aeromicrobium sp. 50.2.37 TaxID=2969305 RepID=UPI0021502759|nr:nuclease-related domain-containing protein [Aeromicrobium sp. 50.2.37]MCR4511777.1 NERD domain-containing protein [Aeromicrobium sp. 50.2.37]
MGKKASYPRKQYRQLLRGWLLRHKAIVAGLVAIFAVVTAYEIVLLRSMPPTSVMREVIVAALAASAVALCWGIHTLFLAHEDHAIHQLRGAWGEDNTATELQAAKRQGLIWRSVDSIALENGDIDHLVVTRRGGIVVVDSKWCSVIDDGKRVAFATAAKRAGQRGKGLVNTVTQRSHGRHSAPRKALTVTPVVVVWGAAQSSVRDDEVVDGVAIVRGSGFRTWLARLEAETISQKTATELVARIEGFDENRRAVVRERERESRTVTPVRT